MDTSSDPIDLLGPFSQDRSSAHPESKTSPNLFNSGSKKYTGFSPAHPERSPSFNFFPPGHSYLEKAKADFGKMPEDPMSAFLEQVAQSKMTLPAPIEENKSHGESSNSQSHHSDHRVVTPGKQGGWSSPRPRSPRGTSGSMIA